MGIGSQDKYNKGIGKVGYLPLVGGYWIIIGSAALLVIITHFKYSDRI